MTGIIIREEKIKEKRKVMKQRSLIQVSILCAQNLITLWDFRGSVKYVGVNKLSGLVTTWLLHIL